MADARDRNAPVHLATAAVAYGLLAVWWTWPLPRHLSDHVVDGVALHGAFGWLAIADVLLYVWTLAWDVHALAAAPLSLLDANVFYPATWALARADHFLGHLPLFAPVYLATRNPVLGHQAALFLCFPLSALAMHYAVRAWTMSTPAAVVAGVLFGFAPWRFTQLGHLQLQATMYLPLALVAAERVVRGGSRRAWLALVVATGLQALCSVYLAFIAALAVAAMALGAAADRARVRRALGVVAVAGVLAVLSALPYLVLAPTGAFRGLGGGGAERIASLGASPLRTYMVRSSPPSTDGYWFLGWSCIALAAAAFVVRMQRHEAAVRRGLVLVLLTGWVVSLGYARAWSGGEPTTLPLGWLAAVVPGFGTFRAPVRLGLGVALAMPALAGLGTAALARWLGGRPAGALVAAAVLILAVTEFRPGRVPLRAVPVGTELPEVYRWLATAPRGPVLEVPVGFIDDDYRADVWAVRWESGYQYASTAHWQKLLNGYSAYPPQSFFFLMAIAARLPADDAVADLVDLTGLRWLVVHRAALAPAERDAWEHVPAARAPRATLGDDVVFELTLPPRTDLVSMLRDERPRERTLRGLSRAPLAPAALRGALRDVQMSERLLPGLPAHGRVVVQNDGATPWPGFDPDRRGLVGVAYRWRRADETLPGLITTRLARDVMPGESVRVPFSVVAPDRPGEWELVLTLRQHGGPWFDDAGISTSRRIVVGADGGA